MKSTDAIRVLCAYVLIGALGAGRAGAHCDTLDGPVVVAARVALERGDVTPVLKWVQPGQEAEARDAFQKTLVVRVKGAEARDLADHYFFETVVRLHRAGEGAPYTGLRPAGAVEPAVAASDNALETGDADALLHELTEAVATGIRERFAKVMAARQHAEHTVDAGRQFVAAYIEYTHYIDALYSAAMASSSPHLQTAVHEHMQPDDVPPAE